MALLWHVLNEGGSLYIDIMPAWGIPSFFFSFIIFLGKVTEGDGKKERKRARAREREREISLVCWFTPQMTTNIQARLGPSEGSGLSSKLLHEWWGDKSFELSQERDQKRSIWDSSCHSHKMLVSAGGGCTCHSTLDSWCHNTCPNVSALTGNCTNNSVSTKSSILTPLVSSNVNHLKC